MPRGYPFLLASEPGTLDITLDAMVPGLADPSAHVRLAAADKVRHALDLLSRLNFLNPHPGRRVLFVTQDP